MGKLLLILISILLLGVLCYAVTYAPHFQGKIDRNTVSEIIEQENSDR